MKKFLLTSLIAALIATPAFADPEQPAETPSEPQVEYNIPAENEGTADCTEEVLETTSGTSNMEANWTPNELNLQWYVDGERYAANDTNAATCTYDSGITVPEAPEKTGYTFAGWEVKTVEANNNSNEEPEIGA